MLCHTGVTSRSAEAVRVLAEEVVNRRRRVADFFVQGEGRQATGRFLILAVGILVFDYWHKLKGGYTGAIPPWYPIPLS